MGHVKRYCSTTSAPVLAIRMFHFYRGGVRRPFNFYKGGRGCRPFKFYPPWWVPPVSFLGECLRLRGCPMPNGDRCFRVGLDRGARTAWEQVVDLLCLDG